MENLEQKAKNPSHAMQYQSAEIWCENLDSLHGDQTAVRDKFAEDLIKIARPSAPSLILVNMDKTYADAALVEEIVSALEGMSKPIRKAAFVGLDAKNQKLIKKRAKKSQFSLSGFFEFDKAREWLVKKS